MRCDKNKIKNTEGDRFVLITGATGFLGKAIATEFAMEGVPLFLTDRDIGKLEYLEGQISGLYDINIKVFAADLELASERQSLLEFLISDPFSLKALINNAAFVGDTAIDGWNADFQDQSIETWRRALEVNLTAPFHMAKLFAPFIEPGGSIVNIGSIYAHHGPDSSMYVDTGLSNPAAYGVAKAGLLQLTRWLAAILGPRIRVNSVSPGGIERGQTQMFIERYKKKTLMNRMATEKDVASLIVYLCSEKASYITAQDLRVDGGWGIS